MSLRVYRQVGAFREVLSEQTIGVLIGTALGMISFVGYTPEFFFGLVGGVILDASPGIGGHQSLFRLLAVISACGVGVVFWLLWLKRNKMQEMPVS